MNVSYITLLNINQLSGLKNIFLLGVSVACTSQLSPFLLINLCWKNPFCLSLCLILGSVYLQWPVDVGSHFSITLNHQSLKTPRGIGWRLWCDYFAPQLLSLPSPICNSSSHVLILRSLPSEFLNSNLYLSLFLGNTVAYCPLPILKYTNTSYKLYYYSSPK